ncbi:MAG TPA: acyl-CoA dehydrogenase family protein [Solirubrobacteraceae bacterium]|nr:acyl-CoA dehydrogenase family protein [Solirubrobacteraceae bacterium]
MNFDPTPDQAALYKEVLGFARGALRDDVAQLEAAGEFPRAAWDRCAAFGLQGLPIPPEYGGLGADPISIILALEALGYGCEDNGLIFSINAQLWACETPIVRFGTEEQKRRYLPGLADGSLIGAHAMSEPGSGSDAFALRTSAVRRGDAYVLDGGKTFVTNAPVADVFVVFATTDPSRGFAGLCAFLVDRDTPGLSLGRPLGKMGLKTSPMSEVFLDDCEVPADRLLGRPGGGMAVFNSSMEWERGCILASTVGSMQRQLERSIAYARERKQFGKPIGANQAVSHRIADMKVRLEAARMLLYRLGWLMEQQRSSSLDTALTKLFLSESFIASSRDAVSVHGGYGYMTEYGLERELRDAIGSSLYSGTSDIQRNLIAAHLRL